MRKPAGHDSTTWNSTTIFAILAFLESPDIAAALGRYTGRTTYPSAGVLALPSPANTGLIGDLRISVPAGTRFLAMTEAGDPESTTPGVSGMFPSGAFPIQALTGHGSVVRYETPVPTLKACGSSSITYFSALGSLSSTCSV